MKKLYFSVLILLICVIVGVSFYNRNTNVKKTIYAFDTVIEISVNDKNAKEIVNKSFEIIKKYEDEFSAFKPSSDVSILNESKNYKVSDDVYKIISNAISYSEKTNGYFDITIKNVMELWNINGTNEGRVPKDSEIDEALKKVGYKNISFDGKTVVLSNNAKIDLGGIAKGYCTNKIRDLMKENNVKEALINMGGNIYVLGDRTFDIGLQSPDGVRGEHFGVCTVKNTSVVTSGAYERYFESDGKKYHHIINPFTGKCAYSGLKSVTIIGENSEKCDAFSTAVYILGKDEGINILKNEPDLEYVIVTDDNNVYVSKNLKFKLTDKNYKLHKVD